MSNLRPLLTKRCPACGFRYESTLETCPTDGAALDRSRPGSDHLGPYRLIERMAVGGMGAVYRALNEKVGRTVAVKLLHQSLRAEPTSVSRFFHEARAVNIIRHPNVVEVYDLSGEDEDLYMVLEFLRGKDLRTVLREQTDSGGRLPPERVVHILGQVCGALHATHSRKIVHRDLKPENIFLIERAGQCDFVKLLDFGVAKLERKEGRLTQEGIALGTPHYMAPEQARGREVDARTDVYAIGCIMFEMLTGRTVFESDSPGDVMIKQVREPAPSPRSINPQISEPLAALVLRCLAKSPADRPQSAMELAREMTSVVLVPNPEEVMQGAAWDEPSAISLELMQTMRTATPRRDWAAPLRKLFADPVRKVGKLFADPIRKVVLAAVLLVVIPPLVMLLARGLGTSPPPAPAITPGPARPVLVARPAPLTVEMLVQSTPSGAEILDDSGTRLGVTPHTLSLPLGSTRTVQLSRSGYLPTEQVIRGNASERQVTVTLEPQRRGGRTKGQKPRSRASSARTLDPF